MILRISNADVETIADGGGSRDLALNELTLSVGGTVEVIKNEFFYRSKLHRALRIFQLLLEVWRSPHRVVLLYYPGYPFFWQHKVTAWFGVSCLFSIALRLITRLKDKQIIVDVVDLPLYQYRDLNLPMEMSERTFHAFDGLVFRSADEIWIASEELGKIAGREYRLAKTQIRTVVNGAFRVPPSGVSLEPRTGPVVPFRFVYVGTMNSARELDTLLTAFSALPHQAIQLHLCGIEGDWIPGRYPDPRIRFHGHLSQSECLGLVQQCDVGIVPYPERGYYNWVFPSKLPLYIVGGVMVLASNAVEVARIVDEWQIGIHGPLDQIQALMRNCIDAPDLVRRCKERAHSIQNESYYDTIYSSAFAQYQSKAQVECLLA